MQEKNNNGVIIGVVIAVLIAAVVGFLMMSGDDSTDETADTTTNQTTEEAAPTQDNIVELAQATDSLSTLVAAVVAGDLVETLSDETASFTVFAPTNAAFDALPEGTLESLLEPANQGQLVDVLTYHVVPAEALSSDLSDGQTLTTVQGATLEVDITDEGVFIVDANGGRAQVVIADVDASNGVVHVIDAVLLP